MQRKVLLVDDHKVIMDGMELYINGCDGFKVVGKAVCGRDAISCVRTLKPDVAFVDYQLPDYDGIELAEQIIKIKEDIKIIILTSFEDPDLAVRAIGVGVKAFLTKQIDEKSLARILNGVFEGEKTWLDPNITYDVISSMQRNATFYDKNKLTDEEKMLLKLVAQGKTNQQIAEELFLTEQTVKNYLLKIYKKFGLRNRSEAARLAIKQKII